MENTTVQDIPRLAPQRLPLDSQVSMVEFAKFDAIPRGSSCGLKGHEREMNGA
jgi:hypothetical protein